jgi:sulfide:quinone oxidoreductase
MTTFDVTIVGGGSGGLTAAARLLRKQPKLSVALIEPSGNHFYQPGFLFAGLGLEPIESICRPMAANIPKGCTWFRDAATFVDAQHNKVRLSSGEEVNYRTLILAPGLIVQLDSIAGLNHALSDPNVPVCSVFTPSGCSKCKSSLEEFIGGTMVFSIPSGPVKCAAAPLKIINLIDDLLRKSGRREVSRLVLISPYQHLFGLQGFEQALSATFKRKGVEVLFGHEVERIDSANQTLLLRASNAARQKVNQVRYDFAHITPRMKAPQFIKDSSLHWENGPCENFLKVDPFTLRHSQYENIYGVGDISGIPTLKSSEAAIDQAKVACHNILSTLANKTHPKALIHYTGYSACPMYLGLGIALPCKLRYDGQVVSELPWSPFEPSRLSWLTSKYIQPHLYWNLSLRGW